MLIIYSANWTYLASISTGIDSGDPLAIAFASKSLTGAEVDMPTLRENC